MNCLFLFICVFLSSIRTRTYCSDVLKDMARSWDEPWKHVVEDVGDIDEHLNKLAQDHPYVIETIQDNFILKPHLDTVQMNQNMWTRGDFPVSSSTFVFKVFYLSERSLCLKKLSISSNSECF